MSKETLAFDNIEIKKNIYRHKTLNVLVNVDIKKVLVSKNISFGEKKL